MGGAMVEAMGGQWVGQNRSTQQPYSGSLRRTGAVVGVAEPNPPPQRDGVAEALPVVEQEAPRPRAPRRRGSWPPSRRRPRASAPARRACGWLVPASPEPCSTSTAPSGASLALVDGDPVRVGDRLGEQLPGPLHGVPQLRLLHLASTLSRKRKVCSSLRRFSARVQQLTGAPPKAPRCQPTARRRAASPPRPPNPGSSGPPGSCAAPSGPLSALPSPNSARSSAS